ncbi:MAG: UDP-N-acetylmuramoyl-L-alanyl-D-glutamate--2,6-diaminopimelate ligase [Oscillospiraceae bacterium]|nr:UDP-N-acetylmuramoyl-L-alanyl-D-glutamate--2,6-diaminopimelate ligase [Oscillospiraceae bacterium]
MKLKELLLGVDVLECTADPELEITAVAYDSRKVTPCGLFAAVAGFAADGNRFVPMALEKGAAVVLTAKKPQTDIPYVLVSSDRLALAQVSGNFYGNPAKSMTMVGITGTNGKTSVTLLLKHILQQVKGAKVGLIGTMENQIGDVSVPTERTTPESLELQALFAAMRDARCGYVVMEVSSHALELERVGGVHYDVAAFTNLTEDHLDFHKTMDAYCDAKALLFSRCGRGVVNADDSYASRIIAGAGCPVLTTSLKSGAGISAEDVTLESEGVSFTAVCGGERVSVKLPIPGKFTVYNALTVLGVAHELGISLADAAAALATAKGVKGRVEVVPTPQTPYTVLIDYAHTPDGLENVLSAVRGFCKGRVIAVFGCGGDRDPIKRPIMGKIGAEIADIAIITSDNPRTEAPMAIIEDIVKGIPQTAKNWEVIENRVEAIHRAMDIAEKNDIIILAGKGHETYQDICGVKHHLDEREVVAEYLSEMGETNG